MVKSQLERDILELLYNEYPDWDIEDADEKKRCIKDNKKNTKNRKKVLCKILCNL